MVQSSHPTLFTIHIRVTNRKPTSTMLMTVTSIVVANNPAEAFLSPSGGGTVGWDTIVARVDETNGYFDTDW